MDDVEKVARAICYRHNPKHGSCFDNICVGKCMAVRPDQEHFDQAEAAIAALSVLVKSHFKNN